MNRFPKAAACLLTALLLLAALPVSAAAQEVCANLEGCTEASHDADCPLYTASQPLAAETKKEADAAQVGDTGYATIQAAIDAAGGAEITMLRDTAENITTDKTFVLNMNGKTLTGSFFVTGRARIYNGTITNQQGKSGIESNGTGANLTVENLTVFSNRHALRIDGGTAAVKSGTYTTNGTGTVHAVNIGNGSGSPATTVTISGGTFTGSASAQGNAVNIQSGSTVTVNGGTYQSGTKGVFGLWGGHVTVTAGSFNAIGDARILSIEGSVSSELTGGQYNKDPGAFVKRGFAVQYNASSKQYSIVPAIAEIGTTGYPDLAAAFAQADPEQNETIRLLQAVSSAAIQLDTAETPKRVTLDLAGRPLTGATITFASPQSRLTIQDSAATPGTGSRITLAGPSPIPGHTLTWHTGETQSETAPVITTADGAVYAFSWTANRHTVTFQSNGGTGTMADQVFSYGTKETLTASAFTRTGYRFTGWNTKADGSGTAYADRAEVETLTENLTLYAQWRANTYTIVFDGNSASGGSTPKIANVPYDSYVALTANGFSKGSKKFSGWAETADGPVKYADTAQVRNLTAAEGGTVTLYAVWVSGRLDTIRPNLNPQTHIYSGKPLSFIADDRLTVRYEPVAADGTRTNVGTYNVILSAPETASHAAYPETIIPNGLVIAPRALTAVYAGETIYAGQSPSLKVTVTGFAQGENVTTNPPAGYTAPTVANPGGALGTYTLTPEGGKADNYTFTYVPGKLTIREKVAYVYDPDKLLQTGQLNWPIPVMALLGIAALTAAAWLLKKKQRHER